jgi:mannose-6-phosphate isomerase-like protein (cupin superfamily)
MHVTRINEAKPYDAPRHFGMRGFRVQGGDVSAFGTQVGVSIFEPGGGAEMCASQVDRVYIVAHGEITVTVGGEATVLRALDSCFIPAGETRALRNRGVVPAVMITVIPIA